MTTNRSAMTSRSTRCPLDTHGSCRKSRRASCGTRSTYAAGWLIVSQSLAMTCVCETAVSMFCQMVRMVVNTVLSTLVLVSVIKLPCIAHSKWQCSTEYRSRHRYRRSVPANNIWDICVHYLCAYQEPPPLPPGECSDTDCGLGL